MTDRSFLFWNGKQSEVLVNHQVKGRPYERSTYNANKKRKNLYISQSKSANSFTPSVKDKEGNLFDFNDMRIDFVLEITRSKLKCFFSKMQNSVIQALFRTAYNAIFDKNLEHLTAGTP